MILSCKTCRHWHELPVQNQEPDAYEFHGTCRRYPPMPIMPIDRRTDPHTFEHWGSIGSRFKPWNHYPVTHAEEDTCGEHESIYKEASDES